MSPRSHVFISYDRRDRQAAEEIAALLLRVGLRPWIDQWEIAPGAWWQAAYTRALESAAAVLALVGARPAGTVEDDVRSLPAHLIARPALLPVLLPGAHGLPDSLSDHVALDLRSTPVGTVAGAAAFLRAVLRVLPDDRGALATTPRDSSPEDPRLGLERVRRILGDDHPDVLRSAEVLAMSTQRSRWNSAAVRLDAPTVLKHAASSADSLPVVFTRSYSALGVAVEGRGHSDDFTLIVTSNRDVDCFVAVWLDKYNEDAPSLVLPLTTAEGTASAAVSCAYPGEDSRLQLLNDLDDLPSQAGLLQAVTRGVRGSDGHTEKSWEAIALSSAPGSALYIAIVEGMS